jgi:succinate dehydrogenase / fumarate reductase cytochrome b subunit
MRSALENPIVRKLITGITGLGLTLFVLVHMLGNLSYFSPDPDAYNKYSHTLLSLGPLLWAVEIGLLVVFAFHVYLGISITRRRKSARLVGYEMYESAGSPSLQTRASRSMIVTGLILLGFVVIHLWSFKYGPGVNEGYLVDVDGVQMRDLKRLLEEKFASPAYTFAYVAVMLLLAVHLRHGVWSALQSLGAMSPRLTPIVYTIGFLFGVGISVGFFVLPLYIYFGTA